MPSNIRERIEKSLGTPQRAVVWAHWKSVDNLVAESWVIDGKPGQNGAGVGSARSPGKPFNEFLVDGWKIVSVTAVFAPADSPLHRFPGAVFLMER